MIISRQAVSPREPAGRNHRQSPDHRERSARKAPRSIRADYSGVYPVAKHGKKRPSDDRLVGWGDTEYALFQALRSAN